MDCTIRIKVAENGFILEYDDPEIRAKNRDDGPYIDPYKERIYTDVPAMMADVAKVLPLMAERLASAEGKAESFSTALAEAFEEND